MIDIFPKKVRQFYTQKIIQFLNQMKIIHQLILLLLVVMDQYVICHKILIDQIQIVNMINIKEGIKIMKTIINNKTTIWNMKQITNNTIKMDSRITKTLKIPTEDAKIKEIKQIRGINQAREDQVVIETIKKIIISPIVVIKTMVI